MRTHSFTFYLLICALILSSCKREYHNPYDSETPPHIWMPVNIEYHLLGRNSIQLEWQQNDMRIDGFEIAKTVNGINTYYVLPKDSLRFTDLNVIDSSGMKECVEVAYSILARAAENRSSALSNKVLDFPRATNATIDYLDGMLSQTIVTISANHPNPGEAGQWSVVEGGQSIAFSDATNPEVVVTLEPVSSYTLRWSIIGICGDTSFAQITLTVGALTPSVSTLGISNINQTSASGGGQVISDGGVDVLYRGVCWGTVSSLSVNNSLGVTIDGSGIGWFESEIFGLSSGTTYFVRAYATNSVGTGYGGIIQISTPN